MNARPIGVAAAGDKAIAKVAAHYANMRKSRLIDADDIREVSASMRGLLADVLAGKRETLPTCIRFNAAGEDSLLDMWRYVAQERPATEVLEMLLDCNEATALQVEALVKGAAGRAKLLSWLSDAYVEAYSERLARAGWTQ